MGNYSLAIKILPETLKFLNFNVIAANPGVYVPVGGPANPIENPARILYIVNNMDVNIVFSFDGINDHFVLVPNAFLLLDVTSNSAVSQAFLIQQGQVIYATNYAGVPTTGSIFMTTFYGANA